MIPSRILAAAAIVAMSTAPAAAQTASRIIRLIDQRCANCHRTPGTERPPDAAGAMDYAQLRTLPPQRILDAIATGSMRAHAEGLPQDVLESMATFLSGRKLGDTGRGDARAMPNRCSAAPPLALTGPAWNGWSPDATNARFQADPGLTAAEVPRLRLKWAFGVPGAESMYGQPTVAGGRVFIGADTGYVYALDAATGCVHWSFLAEDGVRNSPSVGPRANGPGHAVYFGDLRGNVYALDAATGALIWKVSADPHPLAVITGAPTLHDGRLYVPVSSREEAPGSSPYFPCCTFRGSVVALDAGTGRQIWKTYIIPDAPRRLERNSAGTQLWAPAGGAVWHAPTIDPDSRTVYVATGDAYTLPAGSMTDAVVAIDMDTGRVRWSVQDTEGDAWLGGCGGQASPENCPDPLGPDYDFGAPPILRMLPDGRRLLLAGQKSGQVFAHDDTRNGAVAWSVLLAPGVGASEILFGGAADARTAYFGLDNGTLTAIDIATGETRWSTPGDGDPERGGLTAALTAIPGVVFSGGRDGMLRAFDATSGRQIWEYSMLRDVETVNGVAGRGGAMGAPGPTVAGGLVFAGSGYVGLGNGTPGNVLLVFGAD